MYLSYQASQTRLNLQVTLMMEDGRKENQSEQLDTLPLQENLQETSQNGSGQAVSVIEKLKALCTLKFKSIIFLFLSFRASR